MNSMMSEDSEQRLTNIDHTLDLMDFDGSDDLDINEFFEVRMRALHYDALFIIYEQHSFRLAPRHHSTVW